MQRGGPCAAWGPEVIEGPLRLSERDRAFLGGELGQGAAMAMRILTTMAEVYGASELLDIEGAHIDGCLYHGESGLDFAERLVDGGAQVRVPTTLNVGAIDLVHPELYQGTEAQAGRSRRLMECYTEMGCQSIFSCAPYQSGARPPRGAQVAWAESNAIVFCNSVLGARTNRYGDFIDICAAVTGRAPAVGLHLDEPRLATLVADLRELPEALLRDDVAYPVLGYWLGSISGNRVPVLVGLPAETDEDRLKALGAAAASAGATALFHAVGVTPEAPTLPAALGGRAPEITLSCDLETFEAARRRLSTAKDGPIDVVALGSPHFSLAEFERLVPLVEENPPSDRVEFVVCTHRLALAALEEKGWLERLRDVGVKVIVDTCVVVAPMLRQREGVLMTNSGKFAHYTPGNLGMGVVYGSLEECVASAAHGETRRLPAHWAKS
ncbi:MAG: aconitase X catalytic domain-containing protein [Acidobacteriota bacterium]